ncbi:MAG: hypothetical protein EXQ50_02065 [Acidobacteria bacterium]|nr:hypothetical protein [Acidobacteriota bacterium]
MPVFEIRTPPLVVLMFTLAPPSVPRDHAAGAPAIGRQGFMDQGTGSVIPLLPLEGLKGLLGDTAPKTGSER